MLKLSHLLSLKNRKQRRKRWIVLHSKARFGWGLRTEAIKPRALDFGSCKGDYPDLSQVYIMETFGFLPFRASKA